MMLLMVVTVVVVMMMRLVVMMVLLPYPLATTALFPLFIFFLLLDRVAE